MKYLIIEYNVTRFHNKCGGLIIGVFAFIVEIKGSNLIDGVFMVNNDKLIEYSRMWYFRICAYLGWLHGMCI
jgi:hypothetical protein